MSAEALPLVTKKAEARVDSRLLAQHLGNQHKAVIALVDRYATEFKGMGILPFEKGEITGRGQPERFALLNEDQAYFMLSLSRNTPRVVALKAKLVGDSSVNAGAINVQTLHGEVALSGFAKSNAERDRAEQIAGAVKGVRKVRNNLVVR